MWRFENGTLGRIEMEDLGACFGVVGQDLSLKAYPSGDPVRDRAHQALLERLRARIAPSVRWRIEVPLPIEHDLRAWDAVITAGQSRHWRTRVEAETKLFDMQALERKLMLKLRNDPEGGLLLLVNDTAGNRRALSSAREGLRDFLPLATRRILAALGDGSQPEANGIVFL